VLSIGAPSTTDPAFETSITVETAGLNTGHKLVIEATQINRNRCGGITYKFCARVEMMSSVAD
jgi:hypothetical protein